MDDLDQEELALIEYEKGNELVDPEDIPLDIKRLLHQYYGTTLPEFTNKQMTDTVEMLAVPGYMAKRATALICVGEGTEDITPCPYCHSCPLVAAKSPPLGQSCPFEGAMIESYFAGYMRELEVDSTMDLQMRM